MRYSGRIIEWDLANGVVVELKPNTTAVTCMATYGDRFVSGGNYNEPCLHAIGTRLKLF